MIYCNIRASSKARAFDFGVIHQITLGKRGRRPLALTCPPFISLLLGINRDFSIGSTQSGKIRINDGDDGYLYMVLLGDAAVPSGDYKLLAGGADSAGCVLGVPDDGIVKATDFLVIRNQAVYRYSSVEECHAAGMDVPSFEPVGICGKGNPTASSMR